MASNHSATKPQRRTGVREAAAQATRDSILKAATKVFAKYGYDGGSVEKISKAAKSYDRMIYYYFGSKEGLFIAVLEGIYKRMDDAEAAIALDASRRWRRSPKSSASCWATTARTPSSSRC
jgi:AcrR family transcriptional regulator